MSCREEIEWLHSPCPIRVPEAGRYENWLNNLHYWGIQRQEDSHGYITPAGIGAPKPGTDYGHVHVMVPFLGRKNDTCPAIVMKQCAWVV